MNGGDRFADGGNQQQDGRRPRAGRAIAGASGRSAAVARHRQGTGDRSALPAAVPPIDGDRYPVPGTAPQTGARSARGPTRRRPDGDDGPPVTAHLITSAVHRERAPGSTMAADTPPAGRRRCAAGGDRTAHADRDQVAPTAAADDRKHGPDPAAPGRSGKP